MLACPPGDDELLFASGARKAGSCEHCRNRLWLPLLAASGIVKHGETPPFGMHGLRRAGISLWIKNGATTKQARTWARRAGILATRDVHGRPWREFQDEQSAARAAEQVLLS